MLIRLSPLLAPMPCKYYFVFSSVIFSSFCFSKCVRGGSRVHLLLSSSSFVVRTYILFVFYIPSLRLIIIIIYSFLYYLVTATGTSPNTVYLIFIHFFILLSIIVGESFVQRSPQKAPATPKGTVARKAQFPPAYHFSIIH